MMGKMRRHASLMGKARRHKGAQVTQFSGLIINYKESRVMLNIDLAFIKIFAYDQHNIERINVIFTIIFESVSTVGERGVTIASIFKN